jgi:tetratricopeptide (TPR) repeat protein
MHFDRGMKAYNLQRFEVALSEFQAAYEQQPDPAFLFNIGQAQRQRGQYEAASKSFHLYLASAPNTPNREQVARLLQQVDRAAAEARKKAAPSSPLPARAEAVLQHTVAPSAPPPPPEPKWYASPLGWSLAGVGVAAVAVSGGLLGVAMSERDSALSATTQAEFDLHHNRSIPFQQAGWPLLGVGGGLIVAGGVVLALRARSLHQ